MPSGILTGALGQDRLPARTLNGAGQLSRWQFIHLQDWCEFRYGDTPTWQHIILPTFYIAQAHAANELSNLPQEK
jgi:hypothetical protein